MRGRADARMMLEVAIESDEEWDSSSPTGRCSSAAPPKRPSPKAPSRSSPSRTRPVELSVRLTGDEEVRALNAQWRGKDKPTNVLSFPMAERAELEQRTAPGPS